MLDSGKYLLANLGSISAPETQRLVGSLLMNGIFHVTRHRCGAGLAEAVVGPRAKTHDRRKPVPHEQGVRPDSSSATVSIGEWMNPDPFGMRPPGKIDHSREPVYIQLLAGRVPLVQCSDRGVQGLLESRERPADIVRRPALVGTNANALGFESGFAPKTPHVRSVRHAKSGHHVAVPDARVFEGGRVPPQRGGAHRRRTPTRFFMRPGLSASPSATHQLPHHTLGWTGFAILRAFHRIVCAVAGLRLGDCAVT